MADSRNKGASFERDLVKRLNTFFAENGFDFECKRNLDQYQSAGQCDIEIPKPKATKRAGGTPPRGGTKCAHPAVKGPQC